MKELLNFLAKKLAGEPVPINLMTYEEAMKKFVASMDNVMEIQRNEASNGSPYMVGLYNGMLFMTSIAENVEYYPMSIPDSNMTVTEQNPGYHITSIPKGEFGELSKVVEELNEALDAKRQGSELMTLVELSDLIGAVSGYLEKHHPSMTLDDLIKMSDITQRAFKNGRR